MQKIIELFTALINALDQYFRRADPDPPEKDVVIKSDLPTKQATENDMISSDDPIVKIFNPDPNTKAVVLDPALVAPVINLIGPASISIEQAVDTYTEQGANWTDNLDGSGSDVVIGGDIVNPAVAGTYTITYNKTDSNGNAAIQKTRTVSVADTTAPVITLVGNATESVANGGTYSEQGATTSDAVDGAGNATVSGTVNTAVPGDYTITYSATDAAGNVATPVQRVVTVLEAVDNVAPTGSIVAPANENSPYQATINWSEDVQNFVIGDINATNATLSNFTQVAADQYTVTVTPTTTGGNVTLDIDASAVQDLAGNNSTAVSSVSTAYDDQLPVITLTGAGSVDVEQGATYTEQGATWTDNVDGTGSATATGTVDTSTIGAYTVSYNYTDVAGNAAATVTRVVNVNVASVNLSFDDTNRSISGSTITVRVNKDSGTFKTGAGSSDFTLTGATFTSFDDVTGDLVVEADETGDVTIIAKASVVNEAASGSSQLTITQSTTSATFATENLDGELSDITKWLHSGNSGLTTSITNETNTLNGGLRSFKATRDTTGSDRVAYYVNGSPETSNFLSANVGKTLTLRTYYRSAAAVGELRSSLQIDGGTPSATIYSGGSNGVFETMVNDDTEQYFDMDLVLPADSGNNRIIANTWFQRLDNAAGDTGIFFEHDLLLDGESIIHSSTSYSFPQGTTGTTGVLNIEDDD